MGKDHSARNNKGFSLVELIICVAILGVAIIPLYQSMTLSARTNAKAQSIQNATSLGESVMEEVKSTSVADLMIKYNGYESDSVTPKEIALGSNEATYFGADSPVSDTQKASMASTAQSAASSSNKLLSGDPGSPKKPFYVLYKQNAVSTQGQKFAVVATLRTSPYMQDENVTASDANSKKLPKIEEIDTLSQAVISTKEFTRYDKAALDYFIESVDDYNDYKLNFGEKKIVSKDIIIDKTDNATNDIIYVKCRVVYKDNNPLSEGGPQTYQRDLFAVTFSAPEGSDGSEPIASNIYLFYKKGNAESETITVTDTTGNATHKVFFVMQENSPGEALIIDGKGITVKYGGITLDQKSDLNTDGNMKSGNFELITNLEYKDASGHDAKGHIYNEEANIRIYDVAVHLFKQNDDGTIGEFVTSLESTKESNDTND